MEQIPKSEDSSEKWFSGLERTYKNFLKVTSFVSLLATTQVEAATPHPKGYSEKDKEKLEQVETICHTHGFGFVDGNHMQVDLPPGEVKKVIVHIGWAHPTIEFDKQNRKSRDVIIDSAEDVYTIFHAASEQTGRKTTCLVEGVTTQEELGMFAGVGDLKKETKWVSEFIHNQSVDINRVVEGEVENMKKHFNDDADGLNFMMYKFSVVARRIANDSHATREIQERALQFAEGFEEHLDLKRVLYMLGGIGVAADSGFVDLIPSEDKKTHNMVAKKALEAVGMVYTPDIDLYDVMDKASDTDKKIIREIISTYGLSIERERPVISNAEKTLKRENFATILFGNEHDFSDVIQEMRSKGKLKDTALVKVDTVNGDVKKK